MLFLVSVGVGALWTSHRPAEFLRTKHRPVDFSRQRRAGTITATAQENDDWREFRRRLILGSGWEQNVSSPELWAHEGPLERGALLVAAPGAFRETGTRSDFFQAVALLVEHSDEGSVALLLNRPTGEAVKSTQVAELRPTFDDEPLYYGGRAGLSSVRIIHAIPDLEGATQVFPGLFLGGDSDCLREAVEGGAAASGDVRFFRNACGWEGGELEAQVESGEWIVAASSSRLVLKPCVQLPTPLWVETLTLLGNEWARAAEAETRARSRRELWHRLAADGDQIPLVAGALMLERVVKQEKTAAAAAAADADAAAAAEASSAAASAEDLRSAAAAAAAAAADALSAAENAVAAVDAADANVPATTAVAAAADAATAAATGAANAANVASAVAAAVAAATAAAAASDVAKEVAAALSAASPNVQARAVGTHLREMADAARSEADSAEV